MNIQIATRNASKAFSATQLLFAIAASVIAAPQLLGGEPDPLSNESPIRRGGISPDIDYVFPSDLERQRAGRVQVDSAHALRDGEVVPYTAFDGTPYNLHTYPGRHTLLLLPDDWIGEGRLTPDLIDTFRDRLDLLYLAFVELIGTEPPNPGDLLSVAVVKTCGFGCGSLGAKNVELANDSGSLALVRPELVAGHVPQVFAHEMGHNFDVFHDYLEYPNFPDPVHAWTDFIDHYILIYNREGTTLGSYASDRTSGSPEDLASKYILERWWEYYADPSKSWERCLRDVACGNPNPIWAGTLWWLDQLHGHAAIREYMRYVSDFKDHNPPPSTPEARNDLHVEAMAAGTHLNLSCYVDAWRWHASAEARTRMVTAYGLANPFCRDDDGDGGSAATGDCDDHDSLRRSGLPEVPDGVDNNCNGQTDDLLFKEPTGRDFPNPQPISFPARIEGAFAGADTSDSFRFTATQKRLIRIRLCSQSVFQGFLFLFDPKGARVDYQFTPAGECSSLSAEVSPGTWTIEADVYGTARGIFSIELGEGSRWPVSPWGRLSRPLPDSGAYVLTSAVRTLDEVPRPPTHVRFWVSGVGMVGTVPYSALASFRWTPPSEALDKALGYRAQLLAESIPVSDFTESFPFVVPAPTAYYTIEPCRAVDTRSSAGPIGGPALAARSQRTFTLTSRCGIPSTARAIAANVTVTGATARGDLRFHPAGSTAPSASVVNYGIGQTRANSALLRISNSGALSVICDQSSGSVQLILDVSGYFQ